MHNHIAYVFSLIQNPESDWQKVDYLMEFGEWLFVNEYPVEDALDQVAQLFISVFMFANVSFNFFLLFFQFLWASDILLNKTSNIENKQGKE